MALAIATTIKTEPSFRLKCMHGSQRSTRLQAPPLGWRKIYGRQDWHGILVSNWSSTEFGCDPVRIASTTGLMRPQVLSDLEQLVGNKKTG